MSLSDYRKKRDFQKTPEPDPMAVRRAPLIGARFVVHRHEATRLHYDLRLEVDGALASWAVPRGFSYVVDDKRLAVRTEDHPIDYLRFEGVIPTGEYGAGTMTIWDRGRFELIDGANTAEALNEGKLEVRLFGKRLRGEWHLFRTKRAQSGSNDWLLFKARDRYARAEGDIAYPFAVDLGGCDSRRVPSRVKPLVPHETTQPFSDPAWIFEAAFEGARALATKKCDALVLRAAETGERIETSLVDVRAGLTALRAENVVIDGVLVVADDTQRPSAEFVQRVLAAEGGEEVQFYAFDLIYFDEWHIGKLRLLERKKLLEAILPQSRAVLYVDHVVGEGKELCRVVAGAGLPGVVAKEAASRYRGGLSKRWRRIEVETAGRSTEGVHDILRQHAERGRSRFGRVTFTNRRKVYWPDQGYTKGDLIDYYESVAEYILPYLHDRPLHLYRFPDGVRGKSFYQHNAPSHTPDWIRTYEIGHSDRKEPIRHILCNDRETVLYLANLGSIDFHPWLSRIGTLDTPDWLIFDLDPDGSAVSRLVRVARAIGKVLRGIGLRPYLKTSGASGLHLSVPLIPQYSYTQARMFGEAIAMHVAVQIPDAATTERVVARRRGRVYIDYMQNRQGQTVVPPYVVRPVEAASVSTPLEWDELTSDINLESFNLETVPERLLRTGDLFRGTLDVGQDFLSAIESFEENYGVAATNKTKARRGEPEEEGRRQGAKLRPEIVPRRYLPRRVRRLQSFSSCSSW